jgi:hypothetical protein
VGSKNRHINDAGMNRIKSLPKLPNKRKKQMPMTRIKDGPSIKAQEPPPKIMGAATNNMSPRNAMSRKNENL